MSKFCKFSFEPLGSHCNDEENSHKINVGKDCRLILINTDAKLTIIEGFLDSKGNPREVNWIVIVSKMKPLDKDVMVNFFIIISYEINNISSRRGQVHLDLLVQSVKFVSPLCQTLHPSFGIQATRGQASLSTSLTSSIWKKRLAINNH